VTGSDELDPYWMSLALAEAERGRGRVEPNPLVGAALVREGRLIGLGHHASYGGPHAEVAALAHAGTEAARGSTLYVTLEPCCHHGKTPPCTDAILAAGISRVVVAMPDPFPQVAGKGLTTLRDAELEVEVGVAEAAARRLNAPYLKRLATGLPYVTAKWAMTLDGKIAVASGDSRWISGPRSRARVHELRGRMDAIVVGIGTALADNPLLTARPPGPRTAARVVLDSAARLPFDSQLAQTAREVPTWLAVTERAPAERHESLARLGCEIVSFPGAGGVPIIPLLQELGRRGMTNVLVEGGGHVLGSFLDVRQIDAVEVYVAPLIAGGAHSPTPVQGRDLAVMAEAIRLEGLELERIDNDIRVRGTFPVWWEGTHPA
jgi:diaminohydroxyphosphoribosylaminopyrimidine deaminase/5-amino-6-(5-phosphoribosylamino)uracil reductase